MLKEFKKFAMKGNVLDMAVGIIIGGAFGTIVKSLVSDVIMPPIGMALGGVDFSNLYVNLGNTEVVKDGETVTLDSYAAVKEAGEPAIGYGEFINNVIAFLIVAFAVFLLVKAVNKLTEKEEEAPKPKEPSDEAKLLTEIRDLLTAQK